MLEPMDSHQQDKVITLMRNENEALLERNKKLAQQRTELKDEILLAKQMNQENESKIEEISMSYDLEICRLIEQNERKEYSLQFLEQRLVDIERFLRIIGRDDPEIREQLKLIKINPDLEKKRITSVVEENNILKSQLKEAYDHIDELEDLLKNLHTANERENRESIPFDYQVRQSNNFGVPKLNLSKVNSGADSRINPVSKNAGISHRRKDSLSDQFNFTNNFDAPKTSRNFIDIKKYKILADSFPDEYKKKLEFQITALQEEIIQLEQSNKLLKAKMVRLTNELDSKEFTNEKLIRLVENSQKITNDLKGKLAKCRCTRISSFKRSDSNPGHISKYNSVAVQKPAVRMSHVANYHSMRKDSEDDQRSNPHSEDGPVKSQNTTEEANFAQRVAPHWNLETDFGNMSSIIYNFDDLKNDNTNEYEDVNGDILENIDDSQSQDDGKDLGF